MKAPHKRFGGFVAAARAVLWSFFGVRKRSGHEVDAVAFTPAQVVAAAIVGGASFVFILIAVVRIIVTSQGSTS